MNDFHNAINILEIIITDDIQHSLEYMPYFLLTICYLKINEKDKAFKVFDLIESKIYSYECIFIFYPIYAIGIEYHSYITLTLELLEEVTQDKQILSRIKLYQVLHFFYNLKKQFKIKDAKYAWKTYFNNFALCEILIDYSEKKEKYVDAYNYFITWLEVSPYKQDMSEEYMGYQWNFIENATIDEFNRIITLMKEKLDENDYYYRIIFSKNILQSIIERLFKEKQYNLIVDVSSLYKMEQLENANILFELAYSHSELNNIDKAEQLYQNIDSTSATLNNLGVIYENKNELEKAKEYFKKALSKEPESKLCKRNLERVNNRIQEDWKATIENITLDFDMYSLEKIGYTKELVDKLKNITNGAFVDMLERDLKENAVSLCSKCYKSSLIMSGSIIETLLFNKIHNLKIENYQMENDRNKKIDRMNLNELLYVAQKEEIISMQLYHFSHGIRDFRNLVHPGVEIRKQALKADEENADLAWKIVKKIILED
jgi:tetratricopeptide (TPR) repeat protein